MPALYSFLFTFFIFLAQTFVWANAQEASNSILFEADKVQHNSQLGYVDAIGSAHFQWGDYVLRADRVRYFEEEKVVQAFGNITLKEPSGVFWFAQKMSLKDDWQHGEVENLAVLFKDNSKLSARLAKRDASPSGLGLRNKMSYATYSACKVCQDKKNYPLWQISANKITHYEKSKTIYYNNVFLEFFGVPVFYVPFFAHPDPTVERRTGLLTPSLYYSSRLGSAIKTPFTIDISPQTSLVITPLLTTREGAQLEAEWQHWTKFGIYSITASSAYNYNEGTDSGAHIFSNGAFTFAQNHKVNYDVQWTSDDDYLDLFDISRRTYLNSNIFYQWQSEALSFSIKNYYVKDLIAETSRPDLFILPHIQLSATPALFGGRAHFEADILSLLRRQSQINNIVRVPLDTNDTEEDITRLVGQLGWQDNWTFFGNRVKLYGNVRYDFYNRRNYRPDGQADKRLNQNISRVLGEAMLDWRYPLAFYSESFTNVIEPIAQIIYAPYKSQKPIPNEDSQEFYFSTSNLFSVNRFPGLDQWESGPRANVGLRWQAYNTNGLASTFTLGKVLRLKDSRDFGTTSGIASKDSDFVARWDLTSGQLTFAQSARLARAKLGLKRYDAGVALTLDWFSVAVNYSLEKQTTENQTDNSGEGINTRASFDLGQSWNVFGGARFDLEKNDILNYYAGLVYSDECFAMNIRFSKRQNQATPEDNDFRIGLQLTFTNLGKVNISGGGDEYDF